MTWDAEADQYVLESGKRLPANFGILGVSALDGTVSVWQGGDCTFQTRGLNYAERQEIAQYAIQLWQEFARAS